MTDLLKIKNFRLFFLAEIISAFGVGISTVGANWYLIDKTNDSQLLGIMLALNVLSGFLASPIIGGLADKYNRRNIIFNHLSSSGNIIFTHCHSTRNDRI